MSDDVIPLNEIGKKGTVKVYNQAYVDKQQKRIEELEAKYYSVSEIAYHRGMCCISALRENRELEKENAELKERLKEHESVGNAQFWANVWSWKTKAIQLANAREIIKKFSEFANNEIEYDPEHPQEHTDLWNKLCAEAEQFLKDSEKEC